MISPNKERLLVIAPHPDDEVLGCSGLIKKIKDSQGQVYVLFLTIADTKDFSSSGLSTASQRKKEIERVARFLKFDDYDIAFEGENYHLKLDIIGQHKIMDVIERKSRISIEKVKPTILTFPAFDSYNQDHRLAAVSSHAAVRPSHRGVKHYVETVLSYEMPVDTWSLSEKNPPNIFLPLSQKDMDIKLKAWKMYKSQVRASPNPRSPEIVRIFAQFRGSLSGTSFAEAFFAHRITLI